MAFNGSGTYTPPAASFPAVASTLIESAKFNSVINDIATALSTCVAKDGQTTITANLPMATYRHTGVGNAAALTDYASADQVVDNALVYGGASSAGTDTYAVSLPISPGAYATGQRYQFLTDVANTGACTINFNAIGAKSIKLADGNDPYNGAIQATAPVDVIYDGTNFILLNPFSTIAGDAGLIDIAALAVTDGNIIVGDGSNWVAESGSTARTSLGAVGLTGDESIAGAKDWTGIQRWAKGSNIASASAITIPNNGNYFDVTGTTAITSISTEGVGTWVKLHFDSALTLTHHATNLVLPGGSNITTATGDEAEFVEYGAGTWRCTNYTKASGVGVLVASQANQESGASVAHMVTPSTQQYHASAAKAWVYFDGTAGTPSPIASYNVSSITDSGTGNYVVNVDTDFSSANFAPIAFTEAYYTRSEAANAAGTFNVTTRDSAQALADSARVFAAAFGDQ